MKSITQQLQDDIRKILEGNIKHPNQQNIDVHEPEKDEITADDFKKLRAMKKTKDGKVHNCATHVEHAVLGKGTTISEQHAEPDANGEIEWYTVQFEHTVQKVLTKDLTITMSEAHVHESADEQVEEAMSHQAKTTMKHIPNPTPDMKKAAKDIKPGVAGYADRAAMLKAGGVKEEVQLDEKDEGKPGLMFKKIAAKAAEKYGSVEAGNRVAGAIRKKVLAKEGVEVTEEEIDAMFEGLKDSYTFVEYLEEARAQFGDDEAVSIANEMFNKQDITLFIK